MSKKSLDDLRFEILCFLEEAGCPESNTLLEEYEKQLLLNKKITYKHIGPFRVPTDIYNACKLVVPKEVLQRYEQRLTHVINTTDPEKVRKIQNYIVQQFISLYEEYSNVTTEEAKRHYN